MTRLAVLSYIVTAGRNDAVESTVVAFGVRPCGSDPVLIQQNVDRVLASAHLV